MTNNWLVFDIGTTATKAALVRADGTIIQSTTGEYETYHQAEGRSEQHAADWWQAVVNAIGSLESAQGAEAIVITGQMQNVILLDEQDAPVRPVILYNDTRAHQEASQVVEHIGGDRLRQLTGNDQDAGSLLAKLLWLAKNEPESIGRASRLVFGAADYIVGKMTGRFVTDSTTASTTGLLDIRTRQIIAPDVFETLKLESVVPLMPEVVPGGTQVGLLDGQVADSLGLTPDIPVYLAPGDAGCATIGAGSGKVGPAYAYMGTSGWVAFTAESPASPDTGVITLAHPRSDRFIQVAPMMAAGANLEWIRDLFGQDDYDALISNSLQEAPSRLLYLPYLNGERAPFSDPFARGTFVGLNANTSKQDIYRAVLEGVGYAYRHMLDALLTQKPPQLMMTGGGTRSVALCQLFADILGLTVQVVADAENVGIRGAVMSVQAGSYQLNPAHSFEPAGDRAIYDAKYQLFRELYPALQAMFGELAKIPL